MHGHGPLGQNRSRQHAASENGGLLLHCLRAWARQALRCIAIARNSLSVHAAARLLGPAYVAAYDTLSNWTQRLLHHVRRGGALSRRTRYV